MLRALRGDHLMCSADRDSIKTLLAAFLSLCLLSCATPAPETGPSRHYLNQNLGLGVDLSDAWLLFTSGEAAPPPLQPFFAQKKGPDDSPLYIGMRMGQQAFARALVEPAQVERARYFELLFQVVGGEAETIRARYSAEADAVRWIYRARTGIVDVTFHETVTVANGWAFRLAFWATTSQYPQYEAEFDQLAKQFRFAHEGGWEARFENLDATLAQEDLEYVEITAQISEQPEAIECAEGRQNLLWRIEHEGSVLHLFGSFHLGGPDFYPLHDVVEQAFANSDHVVVEVDISSAEAKEQIAEFMARDALPPGETIEDILSPGLYRRLEETLGELGLPVASFERLRPWMVAITLTVMKMQFLGYNPEDGVEMYLLAKLGDRDLLELESMASQLELLAGLDGGLYLAYTLSSLKELDELSETLAAAWYCGRDNELSELLLSDYSDSMLAGSEIVERIFFERNESMAKRIEEVIAEPGSYFVVVGAGHMVGDRGIPSLMESRGFEVVRQ
jgi:uncharacterized protein YbaP (TraB family)